MKKLIVLLVISTAVMVVVDGLLVCELGSVQNENRNLRTEIFDVKNELAEVKTGMIDKHIQENTNKLNITEIIIYNRYMPGPPAYAATANVTIQNQGINDVNNLTLTIETADASYDVPVEVIHAGQKTTFTQKVAWFTESERIITAKIYSNDLVLAEAKINF